MAANSNPDGLRYRIPKWGEEISVRRPAPRNSGVNDGYVQPGGGPPGLNMGPAQKVHPFAPSVPQFGGESNDQFRQQPPPLGTHTPSEDNLSQRGNPGVLTKISGWLTGNPMSQVRMAARQKLDDHRGAD